MSLLLYLSSAQFMERTRQIQELNEIKHLANQARYSGNQSKRDLFNSKFGATQRRVQIQGSEIFATTRILGRSFTESYGHAAVGIALRVKAKQLGFDKNEYLLLGNKVVNAWLIDNYWSNFVSYLRFDDWIIDCLEFLAPHLFEDIEYLSINGSFVGLEVGASILEEEWKEKFPNKSLLDLDKSDQKYGYQRLEELGISINNRFLTFHFRNRENEINRNSDYRKYIPAIEFAIESGFYVFVIGDNIEIEKEFKHPKFKDFTRSEGQDSRLNLFLLAECQFMVGSSSGPLEVPPLFGKGVLWTNCSNLAMNRLHKNSLVIPRLRASGHLPSFREFLDDISLGLYENDSIPESFSNYEMLENSAEEILGGLKEMLNMNWDFPPVGQELQILERIKNRTGVTSNRIASSFISEYFK